jgi:hypothetical protein
MGGDPQVVVFHDILEVVAVDVGTDVGFAHGKGTKWCQVIGIYGTKTEISLRFCNKSR